MKKTLNSIFAPSPEQAQAAATEAADALLAAGAAVDRAEAALDAAHDSGVAEAITRADAAVVAAIAARDRAERAQAAAQRRLETAKADRQAEQHAEGVKRLRAACKERLEAAEQIDMAYALLGAAVARMREADAVVAETYHGKNAALSHNYGLGRTRALLHFAAFKNRLPNSALPGRSPEEVKSTADAVGYDNSTILSDAQP